MKKSLLLISLLSMACASNNAQEQPSAIWASLMGGANGDQSTAIAINKNANVAWLSTAASTEKAPEIFYNGEEVFKGALYNVGNSGNNNLSLLCTSADGRLNWDIYSTSGDYASSQGNIVCDDEGNYIFTAKVRHTDGMLDKPINIIDAAGKKYEFGGTVEKRYYRLLVAKANANGEILWTKLVDVSNKPAPAASGNNADFTSDAISSAALAVDDKGNIYIGGNYCSDITIDDVTLQPTNVSTWSGDSQTSCGNMFLLKLDASGKYVASAIGEGDINGYSSVQSLRWDNGYLYACGYAKGNGSFKFAGTSLTPSEILSPIVGRTDANLNADWIKCCAAEAVDGKNALQNVSISVVGDNMWMCGQFNQKIIDSADSQKFVAATQGKLREGFIIKFDKNNGEWLASADSGIDFPEINKLTGYLNVIQPNDKAEKVYVYGYVMDANIGIFLREYDAATLVPNVDKAWNIVTGGGVPTAIASTYDSTENAVYITGRGNKQFNLMGEVTTEAPKNWDVLMAKFSMPKNFTSGIENVSQERIENTSDAIYNANGMYMGTLKDMDRLHRGIYIVNNKKFIVR